MKSSDYTKSSTIVFFHENAGSKFLFILYLFKILVQGFLKID